MVVASLESDVINFEGELQELRTNEPISSMQFVAQVSLLLVCSLAGWLILGLWQLPVWFMIYYSCLATEKQLVTRLPTRMRKGQYIALLALLTFNASVFNVMPLFLWFQDSDILKFGTMAIVTGSTLNSFLTRARYSSIFACYLIPNGSVFLLIGFGAYLTSGWTGETVITAIVAVAISTYFTIGLLEAHEKEKTAAAHRLELEHAQRMEVIGRLTGGVSHDFNNLLSVISGSLQLLNDTKDEEERNRLVEQALTASAHGSELTKQMLAFGRQSPLVPKPVDLVENLKTMELFLGRLLPATINLRIEISPETAWVRVDASMLQSALINLALNAKSAMPDGGRLVIRAGNASTPPDAHGPASHDHQYVEISVEDTGEGIVKADLEHVFEPFFTTRKIGEGSGLGLAMVKGFVEQSGGYIEFESSVGRGTRASIFLPASDPELSVDQPKQARVQDLQKSGHILVVDDNKQMLELLTLMLKREGYEVWSCESGDEAESILEQGKKPDLLITDVVMSGDIQGPDLARLLRERQPSVPIIMMSGYAEAAGKTIEGLGEADIFLNKPLSLEDLSQKIKALLVSTENSI